MCKTHSFVITVDSLKRGSYLFLATQRGSVSCVVCGRRLCIYIHMWLLLTVRLLQVHIYKPLHTLLLCGRKED